MFNFHCCSNVDNSCVDNWEHICIILFFIWWSLLFLVKHRKKKGEYAKNIRKWRRRKWGKKIEHVATHSTFDIVMSYFSSISSPSSSFGGSSFKSKAFLIIWRQFVQVKSLLPSTLFIISWGMCFFISSTTIVAASKGLRWYSNWLIQINDNIHNNNFNDYYSCLCCRWSE
jgi:hypothetical protein